MRYRGGGVQWSSALICEPRVPGSNPRYTLATLHSDITGWPKTTQIAAILSSDGTNNVYTRLRL